MSKPMFLTLLLLNGMCVVTEQTSSPFGPNDDQPPPSQPEAQQSYNINSNLSDLVLSTTSYVCGDFQVCPKVVRRDLKVCTVSCLSCYCDENCAQFGDCCPSSDEQALNDTATKSTPPFTACVEAIFTVWETAPRMLMIAECPDEPSVQRSVVDRCENANYTVLEEATPVSNRTAQMTYRNVYCAICHGLTDYEFWTHYVTCGDGRPLTAAKSRAEIWPLVLNKTLCKIKSVPPAGVEIGRCFPTGIDTCDKNHVTTDLQSQTNRKLCGLYTHPVYYSSVLYKNVFCALCNGLKYEGERRQSMCTGDTEPGLPYPLSVLLSFNPASGPLQNNPDDESPSSCRHNEIFDPFTGNCVGLKCQPLQALVNGECEMKYSSLTGIGLNLRVIARWGNGSKPEADYTFAHDYFGKALRILRYLSPVVVTSLSVEMLPYDPDTGDADNVVLITANIASAQASRWSKVEEILEEVLYLAWEFRTDESTIRLTSSPPLCPTNDDVDVDATARYDLTTMNPRSESSLGYDCRERTVDCLETFEYFPLLREPRCPHILYNTSEAGLTYEPGIGMIRFENHNLAVNDSRLLLCGEMLLICAETIEQIHQELSMTRANEGRSVAQDVVMTIVSLVCQSLSLLGLFLTAIVYCILPKLRTVPGRITLFLVVYLFLAQFLFLLGSNWTDHDVICKTLAVAIHFFWVAAFAWMAASAYHMMTVFTALRNSGQDASKQRMYILRYLAVCNVVAVGVVLISLAFYLIRSSGSKIGYGDGVCFLSEPFGIGIFFALPLAFMLAFNAFCFIRTIVAIRDVPDMKSATNQANQRYISVYVKLSILLGFSWSFGLAATAFDSDVLRYIFTVLSGGQGVLIFLGYCVNKRVWEMLRSVIWKKNEKQSGTASTRVADGID